MASGVHLQHFEQGTGARWHTLRSRSNIDGHWIKGPGAPVLNPADESVLGTVPHATRAQLDDAVSSAARGFTLWRDTPPNARARIILRAGGPHP